MTTSVFATTPCGWLISFSLEANVPVVNSTLITMLNSEASNQKAAASEAVVKEQFEKLGFAVKKLDRNAKRPRPDFLISNSSGPQMLCEVKTVNSAGYLRDRDAHISMLDDKLCDTGVFENQIDLAKISGHLANAVRKAFCTR